MDYYYLTICLVLTVTLQCNGKIHKREFISPDETEGEFRVHRRFDNPREPSVILGAPLHPYHLPPAEPILPGHTLIRPAIGMLKSAVKFPHREQEDGSGVYGHWDNLGIRFDGRNERVLYTGFRRSFPNNGQPTSLKKGNSYTRRSFNEIPPYIVIVKPRQKLHKKKNRGNPLGKIIARESMDVADILTLFRIIKSQRREVSNSHELNAIGKTKHKHDVLKYVPGKANFGFSSPQLSDDGEETRNKTAQFWSTKDQFNHIKISPEAPDLTDLSPEGAKENQRHWWFYHQSDFEEFQDR